MTIPERVAAGDFAGWLAEALDSRGLTQRMVAERTGIEHSTISRLRTGQRFPQLETALRLMRFFERADLHVVADEEDVA